MLKNPKYVGQISFNRREWHKNPDTGRRVYRYRPPDQWEEITSEALRIIDDETWDAVQRRLRSRQHLFSGRRSATTHLLSGLLVCDQCGGRFSIVARDYYGCRNHSESGTCPNDLRIRREAIENLVIGELARHLPTWIEALSTAATRQPRVPSDSETQDAQRHWEDFASRPRPYCRPSSTGVFKDGPSTTPSRRIKPSGIKPRPWSGLDTRRPRLSPWKSATIGPWWRTF